MSSFCYKKIREIIKKYISEMHSISDKANACIHCGYPLISPIDDPDHPLNPYNLEIKAALRKFLRDTSPERRHRD